jgi:hypothetical protein
MKPKLYENMRGFFTQLCAISPGKRPSSSLKRKGTEPWQRGHSRRHDQILRNPRVLIGNPFKNINKTANWSTGLFSTFSRRMRIGRFSGLV